LFLGLAGCGTKTPAPSVAVAESDDLQKAQGTWGLVDAQASGESMPKELQESVVFIIEGDKLRFENGGRKTVHANLKFDAAKSPREVDFFATDDKGRPETVPPTTGVANMPPPALRDPLKAIYKFDGQNLVVAFGTDPRLPRPTDFEPKPWPKEIRGQSGPGVIVLTLKKMAADFKPSPVAAEKMISANNLRQIGLGIHNFDAAQGALPARVLYTKDDKPGLSWRVHILPYLEQDALFKQFKLDEPWDSPNNKPLVAKMPKFYLKPGGDAAKGETYVKVFHGEKGIFSNNVESVVQRQKVKGNRTFWSVTSLTSSPRGSSNVIFAAEAGDPVIWTKPDDIDYDPKKPLPNLKGVYEGGFHVLMGDGRVLWIAEGTKESALRASIDPNSTSTEKLDGLPPRSANESDSLKEKRAIDEIKELEKHCVKFAFRTATDTNLPKKLDDILVLESQDQNNLLNKKSLIDPWGQPYQYETKDNQQGIRIPIVWTTNPNTKERIPAAHKTGTRSTRR